MGNFLALAGGPARAARSDAVPFKNLNSSVYPLTYRATRQYIAVRSLHCTALSGWHCILRSAVTTSARPPPGRPFVHCKCRAVPGREKGT